jgi:hypothetical protein
LPEETKNKKKTQSSIALEELGDLKLHNFRMTRRTKAPINLSQGKTKNLYSPRRTMRESPLEGGRCGAFLLLKHLSSFFFLLFLSRAAFASLKNV